MKKIILAASAIAVLAMPAASMANASQQTPANGGGPVTESGWIGSSQGSKTNQTTQFRGTYNDPFFGGPVTCSGVNHSNPITNVESDSFTCTVDNGGYFTGNIPAVGQSPIGWYSDFHLIKDGSVRNETMTVTAVQTDINNNVTGYTGIAS